MATLPPKFLAFSPQGLEGGRWDRGNVYAAGYMPFAGDITDGNGEIELGDFRLWDAASISTRRKSLRPRMVATF